MQDKNATAGPDNARARRYKSRPANTGWLVLDTFTGEPVVIAGIAQVGLSKIDADHTAATLQGIQPVLDA